MDVTESAATERGLTFVGEIAGVCERCPLAASRTHVVFGAGNPGAELMIVGEAPGAEEDQAGLPFVGDAGRILDALLKGAGLRREDAYVTNVVKCRPPANRPPKPAEIAACAPFLDLQLALVRPRVVLTVGGSATERLTGSAEPGVARLVAAGVAGLERSRSAGGRPGLSAAANHARGRRVAAQLHANAEWSGEILGPEVFRSEVLPTLKGQLARQVAARAGISVTYAVGILRGDRVPHPRHWARLRAASGPVREGGVES